MRLPAALLATLATAGLAHASGALVIPEVEVASESTETGTVERPVVPIPEVEEQEVSLIPEVEAQPEAVDSQEQPEPLVVGAPEGLPRPIDDWYCPPCGMG